MADDFGDDDPTVIDGTPLADENDTPTSLPRCTECGSIVFFDDFTQPANALAFGLFGSKTCVRARDEHWHYCADRRKFVYFLR